MYIEYMELQIDAVKDKMIMCRFSPSIFLEIENLAQNKGTSNGKIIRALVDYALKAHAPTKGVPLKKKPTTSL